MMQLISALIRRPVLAVALAGMMHVAAAVEPPAPYGPVPSTRQLEWQRMEFNGFLHFGVNTFTGKQWGYGDENESVFNPTEFDANQIVRTAKMAGMKGLILTCKHHDGFCLWPSQFTEHSVKNSSWENGRGDVVKAIAAACREQGLKFGVYLSPWDRNRTDYASAGYLTYYRKQLRELLTGYGPIFEVWFDGANGGDGYYGGAKEKRTISTGYYGWAETWRLVHELQPNAVTFGSGGADSRWVGNEGGLAPDPCWDTLVGADFGPGVNERDYSLTRLGSGDRPGTIWQPAECDVSIRPGWFYDPKEDSAVKTPQQLVALYYASVGRGATLLLNLPPDRRGKIPDADAGSLRKFRRILDDTFKQNLAGKAKITASNVRGGDREFAARNVLAGKPKSYWATDDGVTNASLTLEFARPVTFNVVRLREYLPLGQRIEAFALDQWQNGRWSEFGAGTSIGNCRLVRGRPVTTDKVRLRITQAPVCAALSEVGVFAEPQ